MRKALPRDKEHLSIQLPNGAKDGRDVVVGPEDIVF